MTSKIERGEDGYILCSVHNEHGLEFVYRDVPQRLTVKVRNATTHSYRLAGGSAAGSEPTIRLDFRGAGGPVSMDSEAITCTGFKVAAWDGVALVLALNFDELWWLAGDVFAIEMPDFMVGGPAGSGYFEVVLQGFAVEIEQPHRVALLKLTAPEGASGHTIAATWREGNRVVSTRPGEGSNEDTLELRLAASRGYDGDLLGQEAAPEFYVTLPSGNAAGLPMPATPSRAREIELAVAGQDWKAERLEVSGMPVWKISRMAREAVGAKGGTSFPDVVLRNVVGDRPLGTAPVIVYHVNVDGVHDSYSRLGVILADSAVRIESFKVDPPVLNNITVPTAVYLSWSVRSASTVTLSGVGVVSSVQQSMPVHIEQSTTFVLTAFDSALNEIVSQAVTVTVNPALVTRLVPAGTIMLWSGAADKIPANWVLCDGNRGTPDLRDRFVMGAGGSARPNEHGDADTHTHQIKGRHMIFDTAWAGEHKHKMPASWYGRKFYGGVFNGIDTNGEFSSNTESQAAGGHTHNGGVEFPDFDSGAAQVVPPWFALCYIMKVSQ